QALVRPGSPGSNASKRDFCRVASRPATRVANLGMEESMTSDRRAPALAEERIKIAIHYSQRGRTMRRIAVTTIGMLMTMCAATAHADVVTDWNQIAIDMLKAANVAVNPW